MAFGFSNMTVMFLTGVLACVPLSQPAGEPNPIFGEGGGFNHDGAVHDEDFEIDRKVSQASERGDRSTENSYGQMARFGAVIDDSDAEEVVRRLVGPEGSRKRQTGEETFQFAGPSVTEKEVIVPEPPDASLPENPSEPEGSFEKQPEPEGEREAPVKEKRRKISSGMRYATRSATLFLKTL